MAKSRATAGDLAQLTQDALTLHLQGQLDDAEKIYARVLKADRNYFDALHLSGMLNFQRGKSGEAHRLISAALRVNPNQPDALSNLALVLQTLRRNDDALAALDKALALAPDHLNALSNRGTVLLALQRPGDAVACFDRVLALDPKHIEARVNRANALAESGESERALREYDAVLTVQPAHHNALYNRGNTLRQLGREADALAAYDRALALHPKHANAWHNRALTLQALNRHQDSIQSSTKCLELAGDHAGAHFNRAQSLLTLGDYARGFAEYEWRWKRPGMERRSFRQPLWLGEFPLARKTILLHAEQGLGDTIQFVRYVPLLARAGANVIVEVQPELKLLLTGLEGAAAVVARGEPLPPFDVHCPLASLPLAMKTELSTVPAEFPYLRAREERIAHWRQRLDADGSGPRVALAWAGRASHVNDRNRSIDLARLEPVLATPGIRFIGVQRDLRPGEAERLAADPRIVSIGAELTDFADTAAVLALVDLVISVDTSVAHLAGAMQRPAFILLPFQPDWRWTLEGETSPWYPAARLFRQPRPGAWDNVLQQVSERLASTLTAAT